MVVGFGTFSATIALLMFGQSSCVSPNNRSTFFPVNKPFNHTGQPFIGFAAVVHEHQSDSNLLSLNL